MNPTKLPRRGRPAAIPLGTACLVVPSGMHEDDALLAKVVRNTHLIVYEIIQPHAVWQGCRLNQKQCRLVRVESMR